MARFAGHDEAAGRLTSEQFDLLAGQIELLPTLPGVAARAVAAAVPQTDASGDDDLVALVRCDAALTAMLLARANAHGSAGTVGEARDVLGPAGFRAAVVAACCVHDEADTVEADLWHDALAMACAAEALSGPFGCDGERAFAAGLLCVLGELGLQAALPKGSARAADAAAGGGETLDNARQRILGTDAASFARRLAARWRLPAGLRDAIWLHDQSAETIRVAAADADLAATVRLARAAAEQAHLLHPGRGAEHDAAPRALDDLAVQFGVAPEAVHRVVEQLEARVAGLVTRMGLDRPASHRERIDALTAAAGRLAADNAALHDRARQAATHVDALSCGRDLAAACRPDASLPEAVTALARIVARLSGADGSAAAYGLATDGDTILAVKLEPGTTADARTARRADGAPPAAGERSVVLRALLAETSDLAGWLPPAATLHVPLRIGDARDSDTRDNWVGGLFVPPAAGPVASAAAPLLAAMLGEALARARGTELAERLARACTALDHARDALAEQKSVAAIEAMASGAAHELNNPLAVISGRSQLMAERSDDDRQRRTWTLIAEQAHRISDVITELMNYANPSPPRPEPVDPAALLCETQKSLGESKESQAAGLEVDIQDGASRCRLRADRSQLGEVFAELVSNAAAAGARTVRLEAESDEFHDAVVLRLIDDGAGMDPTSVEQVFTPFFSDHKAGRRLGMGLARARRYVELNGGRIRLHSRPDAGTTVHVRLPAAGEDE
ncbi:MAG: HDOD domain-containing protein [Phycisphaerae bacterium]|nr:HDOD domain-containing protein [Phycisphaerae bacterium]